MILNCKLKILPSFNEKSFSACDNLTSLFFSNQPCKFLCHHDPVLYRSSITSVTPLTLLTLQKVFAYLYLHPLSLLFRNQCSCSINRLWCYSCICIIILRIWSLDIRFSQFFYYLTSGVNHDSWKGIQMRLVSLFWSFYLNVK